MAAEAHFASLDSTAINGDSLDIWRKPSAIARRSASIFSRRGIEPPDSKPPFIAQAAMRAPRPATERQKRWSRRKSEPADTTPTPKGTVLNLVPPAKLIQMTPLEEEMATSPNEEILSAISGTPTTASASAWPTPSQGQMNSLWNQTHAPLAQRAQSVRRKDSTTRIGVWRHGVTHWLSEQDLQAATGLTPMRRVPIERSNKLPLQKPTLSVAIPSSEPLINDLAISTILQPIPRLSVVPMAPASMLPSSLALGDAMESTCITQIPGSPPSPTPSSVIQPPLSRLRDYTQTHSRDKRNHPHRTRYLSSSSSSSSLEQDGDSCYSRGSSATSIEPLTAETTPEKLDRNPLDDLDAENSSKTCNIANLCLAKLDIDKPLPPPPISPPTREAPPLPSSTGYAGKARSPSVKSTPEIHVAPLLSSRLEKSSISLPQLDLIDREFMESAPEALYVSLPSTPRLSEAEGELETHLSNFSAPDLLSHSESASDSTSEHLSAVDEIAEKSAEARVPYSRSGSMHRHGSVHSVMHPPERAPTIPKRSRRRDWRVAQNSNRAKQLSIRTARRRKSDGNLKAPNMGADSLQVLRRTPSATELSLVTNVARVRLTPTEKLLPSVPCVVVDEGLVVLNGPVKVHRGIHNEADVSATAAEDVLLHILASLRTTADLFNSAHINRGMYRVFKENEMDLIQTVMHNQSPPAWEFREWHVPTDQDQDTTSMPPQYTPKTYMKAHRRDMVTVEALKRLILERCQTVIRRETAFALSTPTHPNAQRFNDAFWRIWCFCAIFGSGKGREGDVTGQLDWLKGGLLATNQDLTATANINLDYDMSSVLLNPPEFFAKGNNDGLSAQQLYDMMEIFTCMKSLLEGYNYRTEQAWVHGIFTDCGIGIGDEETEAQLLEEWAAHLLTLGPKVVLEMAELADDPSSAGFALAQLNGWTKWNPSAYDGSRQDFLKEPLSRLYEERVAAAAMKWENPLEREKKEMSRKRVATLAAEIKLARQASSFRRRPYIDQSMEASMSAFSRQNSTASTASFQPQTPISPLSPQISPTSSRKMSPALPKRSMNYSLPHARSPPQPSLWSLRNISPIIEDRVETFNRMSLVNFGTGIAEDTVERAVKRVVDMGFSASQARQALMMTDNGSGLRVDRAVDMLLRQA